MMVSVSEANQGVFQLSHKVLHSQTQETSCKSLEQIPNDHCSVLFPHSLISLYHDLDDACCHTPATPDCQDFVFSTFNRFQSFSFLILAKSRSDAHGSLWVSMDPYESTVRCHTTHTLPIHSAKQVGGCTNSTAS